MENYSQLVQDVIDGNESGLKAYGILKIQADYLDKCLKEIKGACLEEATRYGENSFSDFGFDFTYKKGGAFYDYSNITEIKDLEDQIKELKKEAIARTKVQNHVLSEDGEILPKPIVKYKSDSLSVK